MVAKYHKNRLILYWCAFLEHFYPIFLNFCVQPFLARINQAFLPKTSEFPSEMLILEHLDCNSADLLTYVEIIAQI